MKKLKIKTEMLRRSGPEKRTSKGKMGWQFGTQSFAV